MLVTEFVKLGKSVFEMLYIILAAGCFMLEADALIQYAGDVRRYVDCR